MATRIIGITALPVDVFGGLTAAQRYPGAVYKCQNIGQSTVRYATAANMPTDLSQGFRLGAGSEKDLTVQNEPTWAWVASGSGRIAMEV